MQITSSMSLDTGGHINHTIDTVYNVPVIITKLPGTGYNVNINPFVFDANAPAGNNVYNSQCLSGPCPSLKFYSADSIYISRKVSNPVSIGYYGKKQ